MCCFLLIYCKKKTENSKAFIYLRIRAIIFLKNELCTEMNQACEYNFVVFLQ